MNGSSERANDDERPAGGEESSSNNNETPWQTGIRRRRRRSNSTNSNTDGDDDQRQSSPSRRIHDGANHNINSRNTNSNAGLGGMGSGSGAAIGVGGPCGGNGGVAVGGTAQSSAAFGGVGGAPSTPYKAPFSSPSPMGKDLVAVTPSSVTTAETAGSTLYTQSPLRVHRRRSSNRRDDSSPSLRRQYQLLQSQTMLLLGGAAMGLIFFLFFALPLAAFISLILMALSMGALVPVAASAVRARYELEMEHPLGLLRYLPDSLRVLLTETSIHQWMVEGTFWMEYRHLMLYVIPGIEPEQLMTFINRLPPRHRDVLLQPGLGRLLPPSTMRHFIRLDNDAAVSSDTTHLPQILENDDTADDDSIASGLTHDHDDRMSVIDDERVTFMEAIRSLRETLTTTAEPFSPNETIISDEDNDVHPPNTATPVAAVQNNTQEVSQVYEQDDDNSSFDISIDLDMTDIAPRVNIDMTGTAPPAEISRPPEPEMNQQLEESPSSQEDEFDIEGRIISDAINAAIANYSSQASSAVVDSASGAVDSVSTWFIRTGTWTGFVAGGSGILAAMVSSSSPLSISLGALGGFINNNNTPREGAGGDGDAAGSGVERRNQTLVHGLLTTSAFGFASAGISYLVRNRVRGAIAAKRQKRLENENE